ncbi:TRAP transporter large permease subunit, partial [Photobacterium damselae subsp. damselae]|uniref:TRAP transporter large permease subunit n=1 Tax=Photobacterium damselae TaxID=38293 RepID=UPI0010FEF050
PVLVGVLITLQVAIGSATPPFGCDIFTAIAIFRRPYWEVIKGTPPFIVMLLVVAGLLIAFSFTVASRIAAGSDVLTGAKI